MYKYLFEYRKFINFSTDYNEIMEAELVSDL